ncbi:hypothetical protein BH10BAC3_BH10BAC3_31820 [soil metagenome]
MDTIYILEFTQEARLQYIEILNYYLEFESLGRALKVESSFSGTFSKITQNPFAFTRYEASGKIEENRRRVIVHNTYIIVFEISYFGCAHH